MKLDPPPDALLGFWNNLRPKHLGSLHALASAPTRFPVPSACNAHYAHGASHLVRCGAVARPCVMVHQTCGSPPIGQLSLVLSVLTSNLCERILGIYPLVARSPLAVSQSPCRTCVIPARYRDPSRAEESRARLPCCCEPQRGGKNVNLRQPCFLTWPSVECVPLGAGQWKPRLCGMK